MRIILTILLASAICCFAQKGTLTPKVAPARKAFSSVLSGMAVAPATNRQTYLTWNNDAGASNRISWGLARNAWTNGSALIFTNRFAVTNGWSYAVTQIVNGVESFPALWPSNRMFEIWLMDKGSDPNAKGTNVVLLRKGVGNPPEPKYFWGVENQTAGWQ